MKQYRTLSQQRPRVIIIISFSIPNTGKTHARKLMQEIIGDTEF